MKSELRELCESFLRGDVGESTFLQSCLGQASSSLSSAEIDLDRPARCGFPEVVYAEGKPTAAIVQIAQTIREHNQPLLVTRVNPEQAQRLAREFPDGIHHEAARTFRSAEPSTSDRAPIGKVPVVTAGTSDHPVAWEAVETLRWMGIQCQPMFDLGVAGPHRLATYASELHGSDAIVVVAGMEGALPSVVGGYVNCPVIGVPTSVGYGANFHGLAALLSMLNSCAANVAVVNIDAGFKGAYLAGLIAHQRTVDV